MELLRSQRARLNEELEHLDALVQIYETGLPRGEPGEAAIKSEGNHASNIRNALRLLTQRGVIKVESEATATTRARYVKAAKEHLTTKTLRFTERPKVKTPP